jgi:hypothetical protein
MNIALFVDPAAEEYAAAVEAATFVVEAAIDLGRQLMLSCTPSVALDIGLATFGRGVPRTVEGGERRPSPIVLLPLIRNSGQLLDDRLYLGSKRGDPGTLADLIDLGTIASREESDFDPFSDEDALATFTGTLRGRQTSVVFGLGLKPHFWTPTLTALHEIPESRLLVVPGHFPPNLPIEDRTIVKVVRAEIPERPYRRADDVAPFEDEFEQFIREAREQAAFIASLIEAALPDS